MASKHELYPTDATVQFAVSTLFDQHCTSLCPVLFSGELSRQPFTNIHGMWYHLDHYRKIIAIGVAVARSSHSASTPSPSTSSTYSSPSRSYCHHHFWSHRSHELMGRPSEGDTSESTVVSIDHDSQAFREEFNLWPARPHTCLRRDRQFLRH